MTRKFLALSALFVLGPLSTLRAAQCSFTLSPTSTSQPAGGGNGSFTVTTGNSCTWTAATAIAWIHTTNHATGSNMVNYSIDANGSSSSRTGTITIASQSFTITQTGAPLTLAAALDNSNLVWQTATDYPWFGTNDVSHDGIASATSSNQYVPSSTSWLQTTVVGPGTIGFWWKVDSDITPPPPDPPYSFDTLEFLINGQQQDQIMGQVDWNYRAFPIPAGTNTITWQYVKDAQYNSGYDRAWLDQVTWSPGQPIDLATALNTCGAQWTTGGSDATYWTGPALGWSGETNITHDGVSAARSGTIYLNQETWIQTVVSGVSNVSFWWKVSSQSNYDYLEFYTNDVLVSHISGEVNWQSNFFKLPTSSTTLRWRYSMTNGIYTAQGQDAAWVDQVNFSPYDTTPPVVTMLGSSPMTVECHTAFTDPGATAQDDCAGTMAVVTNSTVNPNAPGTYTIRYSATDPSGNSATNTRTVTVVDTTPPQITLNGSNSILVECHSAFVDPGATAFDGCAGSLAVVTNSTVNPNSPGTYAIAYIATDPSGNSATNTRTVTVVDTTPPSIVFCFTNLTLAAGSNCQASLPDLTGTNYFMATDNCSSVTVTQTPPAGSALALGTNLVTLTAFDASGNTTSRTNPVFVVDTTAPSLVCPSNVIVSANPGQCSATNVTLGAPVVSDNCGATAVTNNAPAQFPVGTNLVTWTAADTHGNVTNGIQLVIVRDLEAPLITAPPTATFTAPPGSNYVTGFSLGTPVTSDNCGVAAVTNNAPTALPLGTNTVTWSVMDVHGNSATATQQVVVNRAPRLPHSITNIVTSTNGSVTLSFLGEAHVQYIVQGSSNLIDWITLQTNIAADDGTWSFTDTNSALFRARFYRSWQP